MCPTCAEILFLVAHPQSINVYKIMLPLTYILIEF